MWRDFLAKLLHFSTFLCYSSGNSSADEQMREEKVKRLQELQEAKEELARLEEHAKRLAGEIREVADWIESAASPNFVQKMETQQKRNRLSPEWGSRRYFHALNFPGIAEMVTLMVRARKRVDHLQKRSGSSGSA